MNDSEFFGVCDENYLGEGEKLIPVPYSGRAYRVLECKCEDFYPGNEDCQITWNYFCNENFVAGFGEQLIVSSKEKLILY